MFCDQVPAQSCALFPQRCKIFALDNYWAHLDPSVKDVLKKRGCFLIISPGGITGDLQVTLDLKSSYRQKELRLMTKSTFKSQQDSLA